MADSNITKHALSQALKELLLTQNLEKISVGNICEKCGMNRKSFYYHFRDKYDLVNWIYYTDFLTIIKKDETLIHFELLETICTYFYDNRLFYQKTFIVEGQNSFTEYFSDIIKSIVSEDISPYIPQDMNPEPFSQFYADAIVCAIKKWIYQKDCMSPQNFTKFLKQCIHIAIATQDFESEG
ncbi:MAG: TetR/AcrR family transcriptional regulator C-terminal domain-containing protein [Hespellia sp.]|nr:TetR/AcrR family transcriptional regulator C-terminal domain-containing protein [Hespellia sp.]